MAVPSQAATRSAEAGRVFGPSAERPGDRICQTKVHKQARPKEAGLKTVAQGLAGQNLVPESAHEVAQQQGAGIDEIKKSR